MQRRFVRAALPWLVSVQLAVVLSIFAAGAGPLGPDEAITDAVQALPGWFEPVAVAVRAVTTTQVVLLLGAAAVVALWFSGARAEAVALLAALVLLPFVQAGVKDIVDRPRPDPSLVDRRTGFESESFPSGHVMSGTLLYGFLLWLAWESRARGGKFVAGALAVLLAVNAVANVYMGVHWPSDVAGGLLWGLVLLIPGLFAIPLVRRALLWAGWSVTSRWGL